MPRLKPRPPDADTIVTTVKIPRDLFDRIQAIVERRNTQVYAGGRRDRATFTEVLRTAINSGVSSIERGHRRLLKRSRMKTGDPL